jgi:hypothetical protein
LTGSVLLVTHGLKTVREKKQSVSYDLQTLKQRDEVMTNASSKVKQTYESKAQNQYWVSVPNDHPADNLNNML